MEENRKGVLDGITVLDFTQVLSGPFGTMWLADLGATVIKVENPKKGDVTRSYPPIKMEGMCAYFTSLNRSKKGITLNLKAEEGRKIVYELAKQADIVTQNFRPGVMDKLGIGYKDLKKINPKIIFANISGYGSNGPDAFLPGYDVVSQGTGGIMEMTGYAGGPPTRVGSSIGDTMGGVGMVIGVLAALNRREQCGEGMEIDISLTDMVTALCTREYVRYFGGGEIPGRMGNDYKLWAPYGLYKAKDGWYAVACGTDRHFELFAKDLMGVDAATLEKYSTHEKRVADREGVDAFVNAWAADKTVDEITELFAREGIPGGPVMDIKKLWKDPQVAGERNMFPLQTQEGLGTLPVTNTPIRFSRSAVRAPEPAPMLGQDNEEILSSMLGMSEAEIAELKANGVI